MRYAKPPRTLEEQADLLLSRGMKGDRAAMIARLAVVNYYRLSGYWHPFRNPGADTFRPNTTFDSVWQRYAFDRRLRLLVMDAIERIEVAVRTRLAYCLAHQSGDPFAYATNPAARWFQRFLGPHCSLPAAQRHPRCKSLVTPGIWIARPSWPSGVWKTRPLPYDIARAIG